MRGCNPAYTPGVEPELSLDQREENLLNDDGEQRYESITGASMYLTQVCRYDIFYSVSQWARAISKPSNEHMGAAKHLLRYLAGSTSFSVTYRQGGFQLTAVSDVNWGENLDNGKSTSPYIIVLSNGPISFKVWALKDQLHNLQGRRNWWRLLTMKEAVFCSNIMLELGYKERFDSVPFYIDNTSPLHVAGNRTYSLRAKHIVLSRN